ncbi:DUF3027 domain-containing protein [Microbacterium arborescens]|uniref:DUF3027 domain-containing protein n=1 Tax=Microbacterium arborescens TaxID=33883 RepID=UPI003C78F665
MTSTPETEPAAADERLVAAHDLALAALAEITPASTVGDPVDYVVEADGVVSLRFANRLPGYPGWLWTVSVAVVPDAEPSVLEVELLPAAGALLAPEWVPWAVRLADYQAAQAASAEEDGEDDADDLDDDADDLDDDADDLDDESDESDDEDEDDAGFADGSTAVTHAGDVDGVDIDALDEAADDDDDEADDEDDSDESDDSDDDSDFGDDDESDHDESLWER